MHIFKKGKLTNENNAEKGVEDSALTIKVGAVPGTPTFLGEKKTEQTRITLIDYNSNDCVEKEEVTPEELSVYARRKETISWVLVEGLRDVSIIQALGE
jgi:hypothetical protein